MNQELYEKLQKEIHNAYASKRPKSKQLHEEAKRYLPGGDTRSVTYLKPFPIFMQRGEGFKLHDADGHEYIDFFNNATSLVLGHAHPKVTEAVIEQVKRGSIYATPVESQTMLANMICERLPSVDKVRFCNSGTEATMGAVRLARAYKQKYKILKMEGGYNGSYDLVEISIKPDLEKAGPIAAPNSVPEDISVAPGVIDDCIVAPFNNSEATAQIIEENKDELAAVIVEPVQGSCGYVPADPEFIETLREVTKKFDILLIFDEVQTFRLARGGCQEIYDVMPDITTLGKIVGGGYPVGAIGGDDQYLDMFSPLNPSFLSHSGTFNGSPVVMAAGIATLDVLTAAEIERINGLGEDLRKRLRDLLEDVGVVAQVTGIGSFAQVHFTNKEISGWREAATVRKDIWSLLHPMLLDKGIFPFPRGAFIISVPMSEEQIEKAATVFKGCLMEVKPYIEESAPELIAH